MPGPEHATHTGEQHTHTHAEEINAHKLERARSVGIHGQAMNAWAGYECMGRL